jgi:hypothetical protein
MSNSDRAFKFFSEVTNTPVTNRRQGFSDRKTSWRRRGLALSFVLGLATSIGLWMYDRWSSGAEGAG